MTSKLWTWTVIVVAGLSLALPAAAQDANADPKTSIGLFPIDGVRTSRPADEYVPPAVMGIQKTVNIPAAAFNNDRDTAASTWFNGWGSYLRGNSATATYLQAPVVFPKGAKKIVKIDYLMWNSASNAEIYLFSIPFTSDSHITLLHDSPPGDSVWMVYSYTWAKEAQPQILPMNSYYLGIHINNTNRLKSVIITYK